MWKIVPDLAPFSPMAQLFSQKQVVQTGGTNEVEHLLEDVGDYLAIYSITHQNLRKLLFILFY